jgi:hypothetical protein
VPGSAHGRDRAVDLDTQGDIPDDLRELAAFLTRHLPNYLVLDEGDHIHVAWED